MAGAHDAEIADKLNVSIDTVRKDRAEIKREVRKMKRNNKYATDKVMMELENAIREFWLLYSTSKPKNQSTVLKDLVDAVTKRAKLMQSMGMLPKEADILNLHGSVSIDTDVFAEAFKKHILEGEK